jgi:hypothetical protein
MAEKNDILIVRVPPELKFDLQDMAGKDSRSLSDFVRLQLQKLVDSSKKKK